LKIESDGLTADGQELTRMGVEELFAPSGPGRFFGVVPWVGTLDYSCSATSRLAWVPPFAAFRRLLPPSAAFCRLLPPFAMGG